MSDRTLVLLKPDTVERGLIGSVLSRFEAKGLTAHVSVSDESDYATSYVVVETKN